MNENLQISNNVNVFELKCIWAKIRDLFAHCAMVNEKVWRMNENAFVGKPQKTNLIIRLKLWILIRIVGNIVSTAYACSKSLFWWGRCDLGRFVSYYDWFNFKMEIFHIILNWKMETERETEIKFMPADYRFCVGFYHTSIGYIFILFRSKLIDTRSMTGEKYIIFIFW